MRRPLGIQRTGWREAFSPARPPAQEGWALVGPSGGTIATRVEMATTPIARMRGLLGRRRLEEGTAVLLSPCRQVHTVGMRFAVDAVFCDAELNVLAAETLPPGKVSKTHRAARCCVELPAGTAAAFGIAPGVRLRLVSGPDA